MTVIGFGVLLLTLSQTATSAPEVAPEGDGPSAAFRVSMEMGAGLGLGVLSAAVLAGGGCAFEMARKPDTWCLVPIAVGVPLGMWLGNSLGVWLTARLMDQPGSFLWPLAGSFVGTSVGLISAVLLAAHPVGLVVGGLVAAGATVGAMEFGSARVVMARAPENVSPVVPVSLSWRF